MLLKFIFDISQYFLTWFIRDDEKSLLQSDFYFMFLLFCFCLLYSYEMNPDRQLLCMITYLCDGPGLAVMLMICSTYLCDGPALAVMLICKRCLLIHMNNKGWYFVPLKKKWRRVEIVFLVYCLSFKCNIIYYQELLSKNSIR